jgi:flagella basal body P-ring formation protein FlgA
MRSALALVLAVAAAAAGGSARAENDPSARIQAEIQAALPAELTVVDVRVPRALAGADGPIQVDWRRPARAGWLTLRVRIGDRSGWVRARAAAVTPVVVAARDLPVGAVIGEADVRIEMRPAGSAATIAGLEGVVGRAVRQPIASGAPLSPAALDRAAPLARGTPVTALVRRGRLAVTAAGTLERPAPIGQPTSVRLRSTGRVVRGRLIDSKTVLVEVSP